MIFALALVCAGQTSSITVTLAGQIVSEGFIEWKVSVCKLLSYQSHDSILIPPPGLISLAFSPEVDHTVHQPSSLCGCCHRGGARGHQHTPVRITSGPLRSSPIRGVSPHLFDLEGGGHASAKTTTRGS